MRLNFILMLLMGTAFMAQAQRTITGLISDQNGDPLIGVNVLVTGTPNGTISDENGTYRLDIRPENKLLSFSYTGFTTREIEIGTSNTINVTLTEGVLLD